MVYNLASEIENRPLTMVCSAFGLGLTWGTMILRTDKVKIDNIAYV